MKEETARAKFPLSFWTANSIELLERAAYYSMASFMVIYLKETLGMSPTLATFLNGTILWGLIFFLPIVSGTLADQYGFRRSLVLSFVLLFFGYFLMGQIPRFWPALQGGSSINYTLPAILGVILIGVGGSFVKPCVAGTVQKTSGLKATLGFGIFYMVINIGSITGRTVSYFIRTKFGIPAIFTYAATPFILLGLLVVIFLFREPTYASQISEPETSARRRTLGQALLGIFVVLSHLRFVFFLIVIGLFWFLYVQLYNLMPLYLRHIDPNAPVELYTLANPVMIVFFQMLITHLVRRLRPITSIIMGVAVTTAGMMLNIIPPLILHDLSGRTSLFGLSLPIAGIFLILSIASMAVGEMMASPRTYEYIGAIAPRGQEGLYLGYANLPIALGSMVGGPVGGALFTQFISSPLESGGAAKPLIMWAIVGSIGLLSILGLVIYDLSLGQKEKK